MKSVIATQNRSLLVIACTLALIVCCPLQILADDIKQIVVSDPGGPYTDAYRKAFYDPFEKKTGIKVINVAREAQPAAQFRAIVETKNYIWDATILSLAQDVPACEAAGLLEPIGLKTSDFPGIMPDAITPNWLGVDVYSTVIAYRTDKFGDNGPKSWADFWDVKRFPGRRALRRNPIDTLEQALLADGVPFDKMYPIDYDRAFRSLDQIKQNISVWWTSGAQSTQLIQSGEVDMIAIWNGRAQAAIDGGAKVKISWNQGLYSIEGWGIPKGTPRAEAAKKFLLFCADPKQQAAFTDNLAYGPTNLKAYEYIQPKRASILPTAPDNLKGMYLPNHQWWGKNRENAVERFNTWLLK
jgi:putative spermidine/putrescine transport system substrate-binding protein